MKHFNFWALALTAICMAACTSEDDLTQSPPVQQEEDVMVPIMFSSNKGNTTRADIEGAAAADLLNKTFVVSGYKGKTTAWDDAKNSIVFDNYEVKYEENTAFTTESNVANWEYVGKGLIPHAVANGITRQSIKYWDYTQDQYDFIAWSTGMKEAVYAAENLADGKVLVSAITPKTATGTTGKAYTFEGEAVDLRDCYISDLVTIKRDEYSSKTGENPVTLTFRQLGTKVRIAIYETVPGYSVKNVEFYDAADQALPADPAKPRIFTTETNYIYTRGKYTIYFPTVDKAGVDDDNNQAHVIFEGATGTNKTTIDNWGELNYTIPEDGEKEGGSIYLGRSSNTATFAGDADDNYYVVYLPNQTGTNLNLRVNYTLESIDGSGETIYVQGATAQIPSIYTQWKPGYAYTYLFKISDKTNGYTGVYDPTKPDDTSVNSTPAGLYPITFDAVVVNAEDGDQTQETITTISTPSITTYQNGSNVVNNDEYEVLAENTEKGITGEIYVTVNDGNEAETPDLAHGKLVNLTGKANLYTILAGKTEAEVIDALQIRDDDAADGTIKGRSGLVLTEAVDPNALSLTNEVCYGVDVNKITISLTAEETAAGVKKAAKFTPAANTTYAFVYTKTAPTGTDIVRYEARDFDDFGAGETRYRYAYLPTTATGDNGTPANTDDDFFDAQKGVKYFSKSGAVYTRKLAPFIGQDVSNLYLDGDGTTIARGYAVSGTDYYYTTDHGQHYTKATNIAYAAFESTTLYKDAACTTEKTETTPADGQAYYDATGKYCVILPLQVKGMYVLDENKDHCEKATETTAVDGQTYFDKFTQNDGVYYTKVIKVQP